MAKIIAAAAYLLVVLTMFPLELAAPTLSVSALAWLAYELSAKRLGVLSWSAGIPLFYALVFAAIPLLISAFVPIEGETRFTAQALHIVAVGMGAFLLATQTMRLAPIGYGRDNLWDPSPLMVVVLAIIGAVATVWNYRYGYFGLGQGREEVAEGSGFMSSLAFVLTIAQAMAWNIYFKDKRLLWVALAATGIASLFGALATSKEQMLLPFLLIALSYWGVRNRVPYKLLLVTIAAYGFIAYPLVKAARLASAVGVESSELFDVIFTMWSAGAVDESVSTAQAVEALGRGILPYFSSIVEQTGRTVDFMNGRTLMQGIEAVVPRFLHPDKPDLDIGNWTAYSYGAVAFGDEITNVSPSMLGEFYMNYGYVGVVIGMFIVGFVAVFVDRYGIVSRTSWTMPLFVYFIRWQEAFVGHTVLPFIKGAAAWLLVIVLVEFFSRKPQPRHRSPQLHHAGNPHASHT